MTKRLKLQVKICSGSLMENQWFRMVRIRRGAVLTRIAAPWAKSRSLLIEAAATTGGGHPREDCLPLAQRPAPVFRAFGGWT